jgi:hypothetical protein
VQSSKDERWCRRKIFESIKGCNAPSYSLWGLLPSGALDAHLTNQHKNTTAGRWEDDIFEPIPEKLLAIASGATPIGSTGRAPDDNGQCWVMIKNIIDYFVDNNLRLYCRQINIDYSQRELFTIIWRKNNSKILHISTVKPRLAKEINDSQAKSSRQSLNVVVIKDHKGKTPGSIMCGLVYASECALLVTFRVYNAKKILVNALGTLRTTRTLSL